MIYNWVRYSFKIHTPNNWPEFLFSEDGRTLPAGVDVRLYLGLMMRSAKYFKNPNTFVPERFTSDEACQYVYAPFSAGKRDCIAKKFAMFSIKTVLCRILQRFELIEMGDEPIIQNELISRSINGFQMALKIRQVNGKKVK